VGKEKVVNSLPSTVLVKVLDWARTAWRVKQTEMHDSRTLVLAERGRRREGPISMDLGIKGMNIGDGQMQRLL
jgi:hypothetical protein